MSDNIDNLNLPLERKRSAQKYYEEILGKNI
jgi:hypothetical protein